MSFTRETSGLSEVGALRGIGVGVVERNGKIILGKESLCSSRLSSASFSLDRSEGERVTRTGGKRVRISASPCTLQKFCKD